MEIGRQRGMIANEHIRIGSHFYEKVKTFKYLGSLLTRMMGIPENITIRIKNLYEGQEAMVRTHYEETVWFKVNKGVRQGCILSPFLFNLYGEQIMRTTGLEDTGIGVKIINILRYAHDTTIICRRSE